MKNIKNVILTIGIIFGIVYFKDVPKAIFTMGNNIQFWEYIFFITGPVATLPIAVVGCFHYRLSGYILLMCSVITCISIIFCKNQEHKLWLILYFSLPVLIMSIAIIITSRWNVKPVATQT
ncbi:MAG: hypothetical protein A2509_05610 [Candidatus Edwardsbacteria bacterium RIFOXYD12_FULL_50_11]|uniref:Uncharacterized protein n=1 Tax=Candidatus Edwardsbacteria bacterium GWF2_54_11 TaxID=1817851 RepID=A0A1F5RGF4_9BACT|nr:MAG: hypothetical protein A2502_00190 [Candidatus Edwardsbacteria bacterium RifOxyC12_full_54_24]OGF06046.1 MAG: hypothetical protein A2273_09660 [Candidatus Edwardsbacteria bacterium RifOxyA12_full_54_48]OGF11854.1 MAG: hypothetical protein A3K15_02395 [Candidatus Edwardsbacteria bacterium GWE2_54_12]OGF13516.1 MAG: hypothetical protein A2024_11370 [Candidatus Edwardsbacteria bacterium GWF2_54_11]OGF16582.1 MAG: hypothetical protein A2509_05610 [Candidatus Edwardsbacteria bacterium RIFOXYD1